MEPHKQKFTIGVYGIIFNEKKEVLLCHRTDHDWWNLPGGGMEAGESPWDGAKREVQEETGLVVNMIKLVGVYDKPEYNEVVFAFLCHPTGGALTTTDEADKVEYFPIDKLPSNMSPKQVERIKDALTNSTLPFLKSQKGKSSRQLIKEGS